MNRNGKEQRRQESEEGRREFFGLCGRALMGFTIVGWTVPFLSSCNTGQVVTVGDISIDVSSLTNDNTAFVTQQTGSDGKHILIVRRSVGDYLAVSMECTHEQCEVNAPVGGYMTCPCHSAKFSLTGAVVRGPAVRPLKQYPLTYDVSANTVTVTLG